MSIQTPALISRVASMPSPAIKADGSYASPLLATGGGLAIAANTANQAISVVSAGKFAYITDILLVCTALGAVVNTISLLDNTGGNVLWNMPLLTGLAVGAVIPVHFSIPRRCAVAGGQFYLSTTGIGVTWAVSIDGFYDDALGN